MRTLTYRPPETEAKAAAPAPARARRRPQADRAALRSLVDKPAQRKAAPLDTGYGALIAMATTGAQQRSEPGAMPAELKLKMEEAFGADFSSVRVHPGSSRATTLGARSYTQGDEIHVAPGHWAPETSSGQELLGHELTHVVQQRAGRVRPTAELHGVALNDDPALEAEADAMGAKAARGGQGPASMPRAAPSRGAEGPLQRAPAVAQRAGGATKTKHNRSQGLAGTTMSDVAGAISSLGSTLSELGTEEGSILAVGGGIMATVGGAASGAGLRAMAPRDMVLQVIETGSRFISGVLETIGSLPGVSEVIGTVATAVSIPAEIASIAKKVLEIRELRKKPDFSYTNWRFIYCLLSMLLSGLKIGATIATLAGAAAAPWIALGLAVGGVVIGLVNLAIKNKWFEGFGEKLDKVADDAIKQLNNAKKAVGSFARKVGSVAREVGSVAKEIVTGKGVTTFQNNW